MTDLNIMGETLWAWVTEVEGGGVSLISVALPGLPAPLSHMPLTHMPLIGRSEESLRSPHIEAAARAHGKAMGQKVWLRRYSLVEEIDRP